MAFMGCIVFLTIIMNGLESALGGGPPQVPCLFIFGDSLVDSGNNNDLNTSSKANHPPYGVDFKHGPTGRFTNGKTIMDIVGELLGIEEYIPPFANTSCRDITKGVNYASGGAGIREETGKQLGDNISLDKQLLNHKTTISRIKSLIRNQSSAQDLLNKCLYAVDIGSNDYMNNYFLPKLYTTSSKYTPQQYADVLIRQYSLQLTTLYNYGARKFALFGLGPSGCTPFELNLYPTNTCVKAVNEAVQLFNGKLLKLVDDLNKRLPRAKFIYLNVWALQSLDPALIGIQIVNMPCCEVTSSTGLCKNGKQPCPMRLFNLFYDDFHPSETVNILTATRAYNMLVPGDAYPTDIRHLVQDS
ncbi:OLC1v1022059C1 [Oldenlandia corymbosa var. corymbosa]|uniref:OLC1v1022059C1 n=1 Tax=Oldenlandia corymbosa var. corymbosa TaxID=529605 RepID=A0AAV1BYB3_OLDCO|nr:OLC1v1022059C1 [Oldenlandia corymbosa var. corymbosa]